MRSDRWFRFGFSATLALAAMISAASWAQSPKQPAPSGQGGTAAPSPGLDTPSTDVVAPSAPKPNPRELISPTQSGKTKPTDNPGGLAPIQVNPTEVKQLQEIKNYDPNEPPAIVFDPPVADMGEMIADVAKSMTVKIKNVTEKPIRITKAIPGCGCTTPNWPKDPIAPGATGDCEITLRPGSKQGIKLSKNVTFQIENHAPVVLTVNVT